MSRTIQCDRCGQKPVVPFPDPRKGYVGLSWNPAEVKIARHDGGPVLADVAQYDLCGKCIYELYNWIDDKARDCRKHEKIPQIR